MSYFRGSRKSQINFTNIDPIRKNSNSKARIDQNIINYLNQINEKGKLKKISSLNEIKAEKKIFNNNNIIYTGLNENIHIDYERKNKARRSLLYLLNKMSGGTFCPQIMDYFKEIRELKKQEEQLKEVNEEENVDESVSQTNKNSSNLLSNLKKPILVGKSKNNYLNYKFNKRNGKDNNFKEEKNEKNIISKNYTNDLGIKDLEDYIDSDEIEKVNNNKFNYNKEARAKRKFLEEYTIDEDDRFYHKKERKNGNKKYKQKIEYEEDENNMEDTHSLKRNAFPSIKKINFSRMNTISGRGLFKNNNFLDKQSFKNNNMLKKNNSNYLVSSEIKEEK